MEQNVPDKMQLETCLYITPEATTSSYIHFHSSRNKVP